MSIDAYPLKWPGGWPREKNKMKSQFKTTLAQALKNVRWSLELFGKDSKKPISEIVISSNVSLGSENPKDNGVAVWFTWEDKQLCIAVDRYEKVQDNLQAIHLVIESRRTELRHGGLHLLRQAFQGFKALPERAGGKNCWDVLGIEQTKDVASIKGRYRALCLVVHPDHGGTQAQLDEVMTARDEALQWANQ
jgi:hypothetical protein